MIYTSAINNDIYHVKVLFGIDELIFVEVKGKPMCLVYVDARMEAITKTATLERHCSVKHAKLDGLNVQVRVDKVAALHRSLSGSKQFHPNRERSRTT